jgi:hypothetical protein
MIRVSTSDFSGRPISNSESPIRSRAAAPNGLAWNIESSGPQSSFLIQESLAAEAGLSSFCLDHPKYEWKTDTFKASKGFVVMRTIAICSGMVAVLLCAPSKAGAEEQGAAAIEKKLVAEYPLTKTTDDKTDIVTAGAVLVLQKDKIVMVTADAAANQCPNVYKDGKLSAGGACKANETLKKLPLFGRTIPGADKVPNTRTFVTGEKFWLTKVAVKDSGRDKGVYLEFFSDPVNEIRYKGTLSIPFKGNTPSPDDAVKLVAEVITVAPSEDAKDSKEKPAQGGQQEAPAAAPAAPEAPPAPAADAPPAPIEPPPPPPVETPPPTVSEGQTPDQVVAILGQPQKKAKVGTKETYFYKDLKVVFVNGKVKDVQ